MALGVGVTQTSVNYIQTFPIIRPVVSEGHRKVHVKTRCGMGEQIIN